MNGAQQPLPEELISAFLDGECTDAERAAVEARLADDAEWRAIYDEVEAARTQLRTLPMREPPAGFVDELLEGKDPIPAAKPKRRVGAAVAAIAAVAAAVVVALPGNPQSNVTPPVAVQVATHAATQSFDADPISTLAPVAVTDEAQP